MKTRFALLACFCLAQPANALPPQDLISSFKSAERGPFDKVRWFCNDGSVISAQGSCSGARKGGVQHGELNEAALELRKKGFLLGNLFSHFLEPRYAEQPFHYAKSLAPWLTLERYLIARDDGWIFRNARFVRGMIQEEDERAGAQILINHLLSSSAFTKKHFLLLRETYRYSPLQYENSPLGYVRAESARLAALNPKFTKLKNKLHNFPEIGDIKELKMFAENQANRKTRPIVLKIAGALEKIFAIQAKKKALEELLAAVEIKCDTRLPGLILKGTSQGLEKILEREENFDQLIELRRVIESPRETSCKMTALQASIALEDFLIAQIFKSSTTEVSIPEHRTVEFLYTLGKALYGMGYISNRQRDGLSYSTALLLEPSRDATLMSKELKYLGLVSSWAQNMLTHEFHAPLNQLSSAEPLAREFVDDRLRSSFLGLYGKLLVGLAKREAELSGRQHFYFGEALTTELRSLNPGLAHGILVDPLVQSVKSVPPASRSIYLVPETLAKLPRVAGILTRDEGNPVSHIQLLARNLGIPNIVIDNSLVPRLQRMLGTEIIIASARNGTVLIDEFGPRWTRFFEEKNKPEPQKLSPDISRLDLKTRHPIPLEKIDASNSGIICGPKAATLGELRKMFPEYVADAVVVPFGAFNGFLESLPYPGFRSLKEWMKDSYRILSKLPASSEKKRRQDAILGTIREAILEAKFPEDLKSELAVLLRKQFGADGSYGLFIRSDTNIEDLPNFSGAGLNKTVPHVVGLDNIIEAIKAVWASPFEERAFEWRQAMMPDPVHVYPSVLLMKSVPVEKSGVMITSNVLDGNRNWLTASCNRGVGGVVNNQRAETVLFDRRSGIVRLLSHATAPYYMSLAPQGGVQKKKTEWIEQLLKPEELLELNRLALKIHSKFPGLSQNGKRKGVADVEFGFVDGKLALFQIRPFVENDWINDATLLKELNTEKNRPERNPDLPASVIVKLR